MATAEFLIGPASQLLAVPAAGTENGRDQAVIDEIDRRASLLRPPTAVLHVEEDGTAPDRSGQLGSLTGAASHR